MCLFATLAAALLLGLLTAGVSAQPDTADGRGAFVHDGLTRTYYIHTPAALPPDEPAPLLVALHANASSGRALAALTGLERAADEQGFIAVFPDSAALAWDDGRTTAGLDAGVPLDDAGFILALIDRLTASGAADPARVYLAGVAGGGTMAFRLACEQPQRFAGVAVVGALMWDFQRAQCAEPPAAPVNLLLLHGTADAAYPPNGRIANGSAGPFYVLSFQETLAFWLARNACVNASRAALDDGAAVYLACRDRTRTAYQQITGGGSGWPRSGAYQLNQTGIDATTVVTAFFAGADNWAGSQPEPVTAVPRGYVVYVPRSYDPAQPTPVVVALHGRPGTGAGMAAVTGLNPLAEEHGFIAVYPDGIDLGWNYVRGVSIFEQTGIDDTLFLQALLDDLALDLNVDRARAYLTGFSNGGFMTQRAACEAPDAFAAYAVVGATAYFGMRTLCADAAPVPILFIHGTLDSVIPWDGRTQTVDGTTFYNTLPVSDTISYWAEHNGCPFDSVTQTDLPQGGASPETQVRLLTLSGCAGRGALVFYGIIGGGHNWPGVPGIIPEEVGGGVNMDIHASAVIWDFFAQHSLP
jgi:polyhydroxybutyrate depolymerase